MSKSDFVLHVASIQFRTYFLDDAIPVAGDDYPQQYRDCILRCDGRPKLNRDSDLVCQCRRICLSLRQILLLYLPFVSDKQYIGR